MAELDSQAQRIPDGLVPVTATDALGLARRWHGDQLDKLGEDYVDGHLARVQLAVARYRDPDLSVAAALHDVLEDTSAAPGDLLAAGVSDDALTAIQLVTKQADEHGADGYRRFITRVAASGNLRAVRLKLADLEDHLRPSAPGELPADDEALRAVEELRERYLAAHAQLTEARLRLEGVDGGLAGDGREHSPPRHIGPWAKTVFVVEDPREHRCVASRIRYGPEEPGAKPIVTFYDANNERFRASQTTGEPVVTEDSIDWDDPGNGHFHCRALRDEDKSWVLFPWMAFGSFDDFRAWCEDRAYARLDEE